MKFNQQHISLQKNEDGFALISTVLILGILTFIGIAATNTANFELKIAGNERVANRGFYTADSGWKRAVYWLEAHTSAPPKINTDSNLTTDELNIVRNFGEGGQDVLNDTFPDNTADGTIDTVNYWYNVQFDNMDTVPGSGKNYRKYTYIVRSNADRRHQIEVRLSKIFKGSY